MKIKIFSLLFAIIANMTTSYALQTYTVSEAIAAFDAGTLIEGDSCMVVGVISKWNAKSSKFDLYRTITYFITDGVKEFEMYNSYSIDKANFETYEFTDSVTATCIDENGLQLQLGDSVIGIGTIKKYNITYEFNQNCYLVWTNAQGSAPAEEADVVFEATDFSGQGTAGTGSEVTATKDGVTFTCDNAFGDGLYGVRCYKGGNMTISCTDIAIAKIVFEFSTVSGRTYNGDLDEEYVVYGYEWKAENLVSQARMSKISIYFGYKITIQNSPTYAGSVTISDSTLTATPNYGYHFTQWNDSVTANPRTIELTQDTAFTAEYERNSYTLTTTSSNLEKGTTVGDTSALYLDTLEIIAISNYGYHFVQWSDGVTNNPRTIVLASDTAFVAEFAKNTYFIEKIATNGNVSGLSQAYYLDSVVLTATPDYGYYFVQWSDSIKENPRTFVLTQDTAFAAEFARNTYTITTKSSNPEWGTTSGDTSVLYLDTVEVAATLNYGYHLVQWSDGSIDNPYSVVIRSDSALTAIILPNTYVINDGSNIEQGNIDGIGTFDYLSECTMTAVPNHGYHFVQWSDGNTENPRTIVLTQDTTFTAEFAVDKSGTCGENNALQWSYTDDKILIISGIGALTGNHTYGLEAPIEAQHLVIGNGVTEIGDSAFFEMASIQSLTIGNNVTSIGNYAFAGLNDRKFNELKLPAGLLTIGNSAFEGCAYLESIDFGKELESIGGKAFYGCTRVLSMVCLAQITPNVGSYGLTSISSLAELYVFKDCVHKYRIDSNWSRFIIKEYDEGGEAIDNIIEDTTPQKTVRNGQILILRGGKIYTLQGQEVK